MKIVTTLKTDSNKGTQKVLAKGGGKQRTTTATSALSLAGNHGNAAGELALALDLTWHDDVQHEANADGSHTFIF